MRKLRRLADALKASISGNVNKISYKFGRIRIKGSTQLFIVSYINFFNDKTTLRKPVGILKIVETLEIVGNLGTSVCQKNGSHPLTSPDPTKETNLALHPAPYETGL